MKSIVPFLLIFIASLPAGCSKHTQVPALQLTAYDGTTIELDEKSPLTVLFFFSMSNPVSIGALDRLSDVISAPIDIIAIAKDVDRPPNVVYIQQRMLIPIVIDENKDITKAFGGIDFTPALLLVNKGRVIFKVEGDIDYSAVNNTIKNSM